MQMGVGTQTGMGDRVRERETDGGGIDGFRGGRDQDAGAGQRGGSRKLRRTLDEFCSVFTGV